MNKKLKSGLSREFFDYSGNSKNSLSKNFTKKLMLSAFAATTALVPCYEAGAINIDFQVNGQAVLAVPGGLGAHHVYHVHEAGAAGAGDGSSAGNENKVSAVIGIELVNSDLVEGDAIQITSTGGNVPIGGIYLGQKDANAPLILRGPDANVALGAVMGSIANGKGVRFEYGGSKELLLDGVSVVPAVGAIADDYTGFKEIDTKGKNAELKLLSAAGVQLNVDLKLVDGGGNGASTFAVIDISSNKNDILKLRGNSLAAAEIKFGANEGTFHYSSEGAAAAVTFKGEFTNGADNAGNVILTAKGKDVIVDAHLAGGVLGAQNKTLKSAKFETFNGKSIIVNDGKVTKIGNGGGEFTGDGSLTFGSAGVGDASFDLNGADFKVGAGKLTFKGAVTAAGAEALHFVDDGEIIFNPQGGAALNAKVAITTNNDGRGTVVFDHSQQSLTFDKNIGGPNRAIKKLQIYGDAGQVVTIKSKDIYVKDGIELGTVGVLSKVLFDAQKNAINIHGSVKAHHPHNDIQVKFENKGNDSIIEGDLGSDYEHKIGQVELNAAAGRSTTVYGNVYVGKYTTDQHNTLIVSTAKQGSAKAGARNVAFDSIENNGDGKGNFTFGDAGQSHGVKVKLYKNDMANSLAKVTFLGDKATHELDLTGGKTFKTDEIDIAGTGPGQFATLVVKGGKLDLTTNGNKKVNFAYRNDALILETAGENMEFKALEVSAGGVQDDAGIIKIHAEEGKTVTTEVQKFGNAKDHQLQLLHISSGKKGVNADGSLTGNYEKGGKVLMNKQAGDIFAKKIEVGVDVVFDGKINDGAANDNQRAELTFLNDVRFEAKNNAQLKAITTQTAHTGTYVDGGNGSHISAIGTKELPIKSFEIKEDYHVAGNIYADALTINSPGNNRTITFNANDKTAGGVDFDRDDVHSIVVTATGTKITGNVGFDDGTKVRSAKNLDLQESFEIGSDSGEQGTVRIKEAKFTKDDKILTLTNVDYRGNIDSNATQQDHQGTVVFKKKGKFKGSIGAANQLKALEFRGDDAKFSLTFAKDDGFNAEILKSENKNQELTFTKEDGDFTLPEIKANKDDLKIVIGKTKGNLTLEGIKVDYSKDDGVDGKVRKEYEPSLKIGAVADDINLSGDLYLKRLTVTAKDADQKLILQGKEYLIRKLSKTQDSDKEVILTSTGVMDIKFKEGTDIRSAEFLMANDKKYTFEKNTRVGDILTDADGKNTVDLYVGEESEFGNIGQAEKTVKALNVTLVEDGVISEDIYVKNDVIITSEGDGDKKLVSFVGENLVADNIRYDGGNIEFGSEELEDATQKQKFNVTANGLIFNGKKVTFEHENGKKYTAENIDFKGEDNILKLSDQDDINEIIFGVATEGEGHGIVLGKDSVISKAFGNENSNINIDIAEHGLEIKESSNIYGSIYSDKTGDKKLKFVKGEYQVGGFGKKDSALKRDVDLEAGTSVTVVNKSYLKNITGEGNMAFKNNVSFEADSNIKGKKLEFIAEDNQQNTVEIKGKVASEYEKVSFKNQKLNLGHNHLDLGKGSVTIAGKIDMLLSYEDNSLGAIDGSGEFDSKALEKLNIILAGDFSAGDEKSFQILLDNADISQDKVNIEDDSAFATVQVLSFEKNKLNIKPGLNKKAIEEAQKTIKKYLDSEGTTGYIEYLAKLFNDKKIDSEAFKYINNICIDNEEEHIEAMNQIAESPKQSFDTSSVVINQIQNMSSTMISSRMDNIRIAPEVADMGMVSAGEQDSSSNIGIWGAYSGGVGNMKEGEGSSNKEGDENKKGGDGSNFKISSSFHSVTVGLDAKINDSDDVIGLSFGYAKGSGTGKNFRDAEQIKLVSKNRIFSLYFMHNFNEEFSLDVSGSIIDGNIESTRLQRLTSGADGYKKLKGERPLFSYGAQVVGHYRCKMNDSLTLTPYGGLSFFNLTEKAYKEKAEKQEDNIDGVSSDVKEASSKKLGILLGVKVNGLLDLGEGTKLIPEIHGGVNINLMDGVAKIESKIGAIKAEDGYNTVEGSKFSKFTGNLGFSGTVKTSNYISAGAGYDLDVAKGFLGHRGTLKVRLDF